MTSRLDRLLSLLSNGDSLAVKRSAATQIGQIVGTHPKEVESILSKLKKHVVHSSWDVRIACGLAIELISQHISSEEQQSNEIPVLFCQCSRHGLKLDTFDLSNIIVNNASLYLGARKMDELGDYDGNVSVQKSFVRKEFNFGLQERLTGTIMPVEENDFKIEQFNNNNNNSNVKCISSSDLQRLIFGESYAIIEQDPSIEPASKRVKSSNDESRTSWSLSEFFDWLVEQSFQPEWEYRHGAVTAIRDLLKGQQLSSSSSNNNEFYLQWLEDLSVRLLTLMVLDRFADYVSDEVVAPIRETTAQTLSIICHRFQSQKQCVSLLKILLHLLEQHQNNWEIRHGTLLTLKYTFTILKDVPNEMRIPCIQTVRKCLADTSDDVVAAAAATLLPLVSNYEKIVLDCAVGLISELITLLDAMDDLNSAASSIMDLLAKLLALDSAEKFKLSFAQVLPKIFPFCRHHTQSFRLAAIQTVVKIIEASQAKFHACTSDELSVLEHTFRLLFERSILESDEIILSSIEQAWNVLCQSISIVRQCTFSSYQRWICLAVHPAKVPINPALLLSDEPNQQTTSASSAVDSDDARYVNSSNFHQYLATGFSAYHQETSSGQDRAVIKCRRLAARLLGRLFRQYDEQQSNDAIVYLTDHLNYRSATHRMVAGMIASEWARNFSGHRPEKANALQQRFISTLNETIYFDEIAPSFTKLKRDFTSFMHECVKQQLCNPNSIVSIELPSVDYIIELCNNIHENIVSHAQLNGQKQNIYDEAQRIQTESECLALRSTAYLASACIFWHFLGDQLNPLIRPLMDALKKETELLIQNDVSHAIAELIWQCTQRTTIHANPNSKIIKNLCGYVCIDSDETPHVMSHTRFSDSNEQPANVNEEYSCTYLKGIYTWQKTNNDGPSRGQLTRDSSTDSTPTPNSNSLNSKKFNFELSSNEHTRHGGECALSTICRRFGGDLQLKLSELYDRTVISIEQFTDDSCQSQSMNDAQILADTLQILASLIPHVHETILHNYLNLLPNLTRCLSSKYTVIRFFTARCIGILSVYNTERVLQYVIDFILPKMINNQVDTHQLQGPIEALFHVIDRQALNIVPYAKHLMLPCIQCMTHQDWYIRSIASNCFAVLIKYYALHTDDKITQHSNGVESDGNFLEQLFDNTKVPAYQLPMRVQAEIRPYQYDGINWLMFLKRYNLSCVLADDMGLGKTLQTICVLASDIVERRKENLEIRPSLVIAPPTLIRHWTSEMSKFVGDDILRPLLYTGKNLAEREGLRIKYQRTPNDYTVIVVSYDIVRSDIGFFSTIPFNYCVLDEGHIIRNSKTKLSKAIRQISAVHRLILSGTPIQNNALELWKLFDFLMPGYLGSEKQFIRRYQKPLLASSRDRDLELGQLAMDVLHKQVKPFMLRRMKSDVLNDLPPKILQDYYCDLSSIQCMLYEDFTHQTKEEIHHGDEEKQNAGTHVFKALQYLRKLCNHPCLILTPQHPKWGNVQIELKESQMTLNDIRLSGKLLALKELLIECGIGLSKDAVVSTHRALVFCQMKAMVDVIITQVLGTMENVSYLRLDGSMSAADRFNTVNLFNADPSIDLLILTTHVGGLGLNLTGADTVIFVEHDWNPSKDLQAMDRAHRIGQKKVVNVYRLITRSTIEEKIMNLQRFKTNLADTVLASDNATSLLNLDKNTSLLDLISFGDETKGQSLVTGDDDDDTSKKTTNYRKQSLQTILDAFSDSNDQDAYSDEYDLNKFCSTTTTLKK